MVYPSCARGISPGPRALFLNGDLIAAAAFEAELIAVAPWLRLEIVATASAASQRVEQHPVPVVIFIELQQPRAPLVAFARWVRQRYPGPPPLLIALTHDLSCAAMPPAQFGVDAVLLQPIARDDLAALVVLVRAAAGLDPDSDSSLLREHCSPYQGPHSEAELR